MNDFSIINLNLKNWTQYQIILIGLLGSFLMFLGDMTLYYDSNDYDGKDTMNNIIGIMKDVSIKRLYLGGLLGSVCAFIYCIGFFHIVLGIQEKYFNLAWFVFLINVFGMILGGSYHIQCAYFGLLSRYENKGAFDEFLKFLKFQAKIVFGIMALANIAMAWIILTGFAVFPSRQAFFTPIFLIILTPIAGRLPKGLYMIVRGGWLNIICFVYTCRYLLALVKKFSGGNL